MIVIIKKRKKLLRAMLLSNGSGACSAIDIAKRKKLLRRGRQLKAAQLEYDMDELELKRQRLQAQKQERQRPSPIVRFASYLSLVRPRASWF